ncbi:aldo/keto reductase [Pseudogemmobacter humi]|uniref:General stress protein 69 n=1 Tax=Pseudogemmobacter humi TaxID=2483812 RepID=A0A3P5WE29_9RHOB|nr:aldo/keto reductase [Pseudogemmobacter humi]VDC19928.1 General stress protein 69 [Pseudogemmobacter humi]
MQKRQLGRTDLHIAPLVLGTNTAGWTADEATSFAVFDAYLAQGFTALDTADVYSRWVPGNDSESEKIIGRWMKARGNRDKVHIFTKVGSDIGQGRIDLSARWIETAVEGSLKRLQTDYIDLYQSHWFDPAVGQEETLMAYERLVQAGKVRWIGASNFDAGQLGEALGISAAKGIARYQTIQNEYSLMRRDAYEGAMQDLVLAEGLSLIPYYSLAAGFLTGKYRRREDLEGRARASSLERYFTDKGLAVLAALDEVGAELSATPAEVALAWVSAQPGVIGPLASATSVAHLDSLARGARLDLSADQIARLSAV